MSSEEIGDYFNLKEVKDELGIDDKENDNELKRKGKNANRDLTVVLMRFTDLLPLTGDLQKIATTATTYHVISQWWDKKDKKDKAESFMKRFESTKKEIIKTLEDKPKENPRTKPASVGVGTSSNILKNIHNMTDKNGSFFNH